MMSGAYFLSACDKYGGRRGADGGIVVAFIELLMLPLRLDETL